MKIFINLLYAFLFLILISGNAYSLNYYVSASGNNNNNGLTTLTPWQSVSKVNSMMTIFLPGDQILFKRGDSFFGTLNVTKSGTAGSLITFGGYGSGNLPVITGKKLLTGWTLHSGNIYKTSISDTVAHLYIGGQIMTIARFPNTGYLKVDAGNGTGGFYDGALTQSSGYWNGATCRLRTINWAYENKVVSNFSGGNITFSSGTTYTTGANYGYYLDNKLSLLDTPNEWFYDIPTGQLYFYAPGGVNPNTLSVEAVVSNNGFLNTNTNYLQIQDLKITGFKDMGINCYAGSNNIFKGCQITQTGLYGISINGSNNLIDNNILEDNLNCGIDGVLTNSVIKNNTLNRTGLIAGYGRSGWGYVAMVQNVSPGTIIEFNKIDSTGYNGISVAKNTIVRNNIIDYSCLVLNDGGGIDITDCDGLMISNNIVSNTIGNFETSGVPNSYSCGIYVNGALMKNSTIQNNTVSFSRYVGILVDHRNTPVNNKITGNILYDNFHSQILFTDYSAAVFIPSYNTIVKHNVFYSLQSSQNCMEQRSHVSTTGFSDYGTFDSNYFCNPYSDYVVRKTKFLSTYTTNTYTLPAWKTTFGEDPNSRTIPFQFSQYKIADTLSSNYITNSKFDVNVTGWFAWPSGMTIAKVTHPLLDNGSMRVRWSGVGNSEGLVMSNTYPIVKNENYLVSISFVGDHTGTFNLWGRSSLSSSYTTFPQTYMNYENFRKEHSFTFKADTTDPAAKLSVGLKLPDSLVYVDNINVYHVSVVKVDSTQMSKLFTNETNFATSVSLGGITYKDLNGNPVTGSISLQPYSSQILINENPDPASAKTLQLKALIEGLYNQVTDLMTGDTVRTYLRSSSSPYNIVDSSKSYLNASGNGSFNFLNASNSVNYYLTVEHRSALETWSKLPVSFTSDNLSYDFTASANMAFGNNLKVKGSRYTLFSGDVNKDDEISLTDQLQTYNAGVSFITGYVREDIDGNGIVNLNDMTLVSNNASIFVRVLRP